MLDIKFIRDNRDMVKEGIKNRGQKIDIDELLAIDEDRRKLLTEVETLKAERNKANNEISAIMKEKRNPFRMPFKISRSNLFSSVKILSFRNIKTFLFDTKNSRVQYKLGLT